MEGSAMSGERGEERGRRVQGAEGGEREELGEREEREARGARRAEGGERKELGVGEGVGRGARGAEKEGGE
eukprot:505541-Rhodomonas_salina.1